MKNFIQKIKNYFLNHQKLAEVLRFLIIGGLATIVDFLAMGIVIYIFNAQSLNYNLINAFLSKGNITSLSAVVGTGVGFIFGLLFNYIFSIIFVFSNTKFAKTKTGFLVFTIFSSIGFLIHIFGMWLANGVMGINEWIVKILLTIIVLVFNYITRKKFVFNERNVNKSKNDNANI